VPAVGLAAGHFIEAVVGTYQEIREFGGLVASVTQALPRFMSMAAIAVDDDDAALADAAKSET